MSKKGFALLSKEELQKVTSKGGIAAHAKGNAHEWTTEEAREMGRKGGLARANKDKEKK